MRMWCTIRWRQKNEIVVNSRRFSTYISHPYSHRNHSFEFGLGDSFFPFASLSQCTFASFSLSFKTCNIIKNTHTKKLFSCYNLNKWEKSLSSVRFFIPFRCAERLVNAKKETDRYPYTREERKQNAVSEWMRLHFINERSEKWIERKWKKKREIAAPSFKWNEIFLFDNKWAAWFFGLICHLSLPLNALQIL